MTMKAPSVLVIHDRLSPLSSSSFQSIVFLSSVSRRHLYHRHSAVVIIPSPLSESRYRCRRLPVIRGPLFSTSSLPVIVISRFRYRLSVTVTGRPRYHRRHRNRPPFPMTHSVVLLLSAEGGASGIRVPVTTAWVLSAGGVIGERQLTGLSDDGEWGVDEEETRRREPTCRGVRWQSC